jgi:sialate O-acetylesterase
MMADPRGDSLSGVGRVLALGVSAFLLAFSTAGPCRADVRPNPIFSDGAVLQRGRTLPVWGTADDGESVTVTVQGRTAGTVCRGRRWRVDLPPLEVGGPVEMTIRGKNTITLRGLLVGEVWVCSGQSNMELTVADCDRADREIANSANPQIRLCKVPRQAADAPLEEVSLSWRECGPSTVGNFSGVGYFFGRDLQEALKVPLGLIDASYGSTPAEAWMRPETLRSRPEFRSILDEYARQVEDSPRAMTQYGSEMEAWERAAAEAKATGRKPPPRPQLPLGPFNWRRPSGLYHAMVLPLVPYAIRGVIWYQGERNSPRAYQYRTLFPALIADWRRAWGQGDFPFLFVQLAPFGKRGDEPRESAWAELREAQLLTSQSVPSTAMAVITDVGDEADIHPRRKQPVGERLALAARAVAYGEPVSYRGPSYRDFEVQGDRIVVSFDHAGRGLECRGDRLRGFAICGPDRTFVAAEVQIVGHDRVAVHSPRVSRPVAVRFGWADYPVVNLWNRDGLPASPFRTDDFPGLTRPKP